ncbi:hypothetical protein ACVJGD_008313 [Bradyrhizobium sp. USDA 10063]
MGRCWYVHAIDYVARFGEGVGYLTARGWALWHTTVAEFIGLPSHLMLFCGMALGYMDREHPINSLRADRADLSEFATISGF